MAARWHNGRDCGRAVWWLIAVMRCRQISLSPSIWGMLLAAFALCNETGCWL